jgi:exodeoxyribonuclease VII small subunit
MAESHGFEGNLEKLEERVRKLETGDVSLEEALLLFEEGVGFAQTCHEQLDAAEKRVAALTRSATGIEDKPLADGAED